MDRGTWLKLLHLICDEADKILLANFRSADLGVKSKPDGTLVTRVDTVIETLARELAAKLEPALGILGEEFGASGSATERLIIDPLDATNNFIRGIPIFATLAAIEIDGEIVAGIASAPALGARWSAAQGDGAYRNEERIHVSRTARIEDAQLFHAGFGALKQAGHFDAVTRLALRTWRQRGFGDFYQDVLVAEGAGDIALDFGIAPWDIAALKVIVEEAGGSATSASGRPSIYEGSLISTNRLLHRGVLDALAEHLDATT